MRTGGSGTRHGPAPTTNRCTAVAAGKRWDEPISDLVLKQDVKEFYWQSIFVFGKMGDKGVSFLVERVSSADLNTRTNAINLLASLLIPPEAALPLHQRFWKEDDAELRKVILGGLERTLYSPASLRAFFEQVAAKSPDAAAVKYAGETLSHIKKMTEGMVQLAQKRKPSAAAFQREYDLLFESRGKQGDYDALWIASTRQDEPRLKTLRERILQRNSDEAFSDYLTAQQGDRGAAERNRQVGQPTPAEAAQSVGFAVRSFCPESSTTARVDWEGRAATTALTRLTFDPPIFRLTPLMEQSSLV